MRLLSILTLPVEFDASRRGMNLLQEANLLQSEEDKRGARSLLTAAGLTYLAAAVTSVLLYYTKNPGNYSAARPQRFFRSILTPNCCKK